MATGGQKYLDAASRIKALGAGILPDAFSKTAKGVFGFDGQTEGTTLQQLRESGNAEGLLPTSNGRTDGMGGSAGAESDEVKDRKKFEQDMAVLAGINQRMQDINAEIARLNARIREAEEDIAKTEKEIERNEQDLSELDEAMAAWENGAPLTGDQARIVDGMKKAYKAKTGRDLDRSKHEECEKAADEYRHVVDQDNQGKREHIDKREEEKRRIQDKADKAKERLESIKNENTPLEQKDQKTKEVLEGLKDESLTLYKVKKSVSNSEIDNEINHVLKNSSEKKSLEQRKVDLSDLQSAWSVESAKPEFNAKANEKSVADKSADNNEVALKEDANLSVSKLENKASV